MSAAPSLSTASVEHSRIIRGSFAGWLGLSLMVVGALFMMGALSISSTGQNSSTPGSLSSPPWPGQTALPGAAITPDSGTVANGTYSNAYFNFSYRVPEQLQGGGNPFTASQKDYREETSDIHQDGAKKYLLLDAAGAGNDSVELVAIDTTEEPRITPSDVVLAEMASLRSLGGKMMGAATEKEIGGRTFSIGKAQVNGEVRGATENLYAGFAAVKQGSYVLTWTFFADSPARLEQLLGTLETVSFER
jgi:hypothetical protein